MGDMKTIIYLHNLSNITLKIVTHSVNKIYSLLQHIKTSG